LKAPVLERINLISEIDFSREFCVLLHIAEGNAVADQIKEQRPETDSDIAFQNSVSLMFTTYLPSLQELESSLHQEDSPRRT
jgi:hypothetical protein